MKSYDNIIELPHFEPKYHQRMSIYNRSAQFAPFAALTGYEDAVKEKGRLTDNKIITIKIFSDYFFIDFEHIYNTSKISILSIYIYFLETRKNAFTIICIIDKSFK